MAEKQVKFDAKGTPALTQAMLDLLNAYPGLKPGEKFQFATLGESRGKALFPSAGAVIDNEVKDILGQTHQTCVYGFAAVCRVSGLNEQRRIATKEWLDTLGRWLNRETVTIGKTNHTLTDYPALIDNRILRSIQPTVPTHLDGVGENGAEDWVCQVEARYTNDFKGG